MRRALLTLDAAGVTQLNRACRGQRGARQLASLAARWLAGVEVALMLGLALVGRRRSALRMLGAVALVHVASEALGWAWRRPRPFVALEGVEALIAHAGGRSFPSRHVASALAMALIGWRAHPRLGSLMAAVGGGLGLSRVAAGVHYPSDIVAGLGLGLIIGRLLRD